MLKKFLTVLLAGAMIVSYSTMTTSCNDYDDDIANLNERIDNLESVTIASMQSQITSIQSSITSLQSNLSSSISSLTSQIESVSGDVDDLESTMQSELASLESTLKAYVDGEIDDVEEALSKLESSLSNYYTKEGVQSYVNSLLLNYYTKTEVDNLFSQASSAVATEIADRKEADSYLQSQIDSLESIISDLKTQIAVLQTEGTYTAKDIEELEAAVEENEDAIDALQDQIEDNEAAIATLESALSELAADFDEFVAGLDAWFGEQFATYIENYVTYDYLVKYVSGVAVALWEQILSELKDPSTDYYQAVLAIVKSITDDLDTRLTQAESDIDVLEEDLAALEKAFEAYKAEMAETIAAIEDRLDALETDVDDLQERTDSLETYVDSLASRIQSMVYIPAYSDGKVYVKGKQYVTDADGNEVVLYCPSTEVGVYDNVLTVEFFVSPASAGDAIVEAWNNEQTRGQIRLLTNEATVKANTSETTLSIVNVMGSGSRIAFAIHSPYTFTTDASKTLMFAIWIEDSATGSNAGNSFTTEFLELAPMYRAGDVSDYFALAYNDSGEYTVNNSPSLESKVEYDENVSVNLFKNYEIVYVGEDGTIYALDNIPAEYEWSATLGETYENVSVTPGGYASGQLIKGKYTISDRVITFNKPGYTVLNDYVTVVGEFTLTVDGDETAVVFDGTHKVTVSTSSENI